MCNDELNTFLKIFFFVNHSFTTTNSRSFKRVLLYRDDDSTRSVAKCFFAQNKKFFLFWNSVPILIRRLEVRYSILLSNESSGFLWTLIASLMCLRSLNNFQNHSPIPLIGNEKKKNSTRAVWWSNFYEWLLAESCGWKKKNYRVYSHCHPQFMETLIKNWYNI